jgi:hypothetical protein
MKARGQGQEPRCKPAPKKEAHMKLVERRNKVKSFRIADRIAKTLRVATVRAVHRNSYLMTDKAPAHKGVGEEFVEHTSVNHSKEEYARGTYWHVTTAECHFSQARLADYLCLA